LSQFYLHVIHLSGQLLYVSSRHISHRWTIVRGRLPGIEVPILIFEGVAIVAVAIEVVAIPWSIVGEVLRRT